MRAHTLAAGAAALLSLATLLVLGLLHLLSPEFDPSWRMVSEYANGRYGWLLSAMFGLWALSSWLLAYAISPFAGGWLARIGIVFLIVAGVGEAMAAVFDINHSLHMHAAILGMNGLPIAAVLIGVGLARAGLWGRSKYAMLWLSSLPLFSVVLMAAAMAHFFAGLSHAGITMSADAKPLTELPAGVTAFSGWANRVLIVAYCLWAIVVALRVRTDVAKQRVE